MSQPLHKAQAKNLELLKASEQAERLRHSMLGAGVAAFDWTVDEDHIVGDGVSPFDLTFPGRGARTFFKELCDAMRAKRLASTSCSEALDRLAGT